MFLGGLHDHWRSPRPARGATFRVIIALREVPGRDRGDDADRLLQDDDALIRLMVRNNVAIDPFRLFGEPFDERGGVGHFALRLGERLAAFGGADLRQILLRRHHQLEPFAQDRSALFRQHRRPGRPGGVRRFDGAAGFRGALIGDLGDHLASGGIVDRKAPASVGAGPGAVDEAVGLQQSRIAQQARDVGVERHECILQMAPIRVRRSDGRRAS